MANPKWMQCKANGTVGPFDEDLFKTEKYIPYNPSSPVPAEQPTDPAGDDAEPSAPRRRRAVTPQE